MKFGSAEPELVKTLRAMSRKLQRVVRCFSRDSNVVWMRLAESRRSNTHELRFCAKLLDRRAAHVSHAAAQSTNHLEQYIAHRPLVRNPAFDSLGHQLLRRHFTLLEIPVGAAILHRGETTHPTD